MRCAGPRCSNCCIRQVYTDDEQLIKFVYQFNSIRQPLRPAGEIIHIKLGPHFDLLQVRRTVQRKVAAILRAELKIIADI